MSENLLQSARHQSVRKVLRVGGPAVALLGLLFLLIGMISFFSSFGSFAPPRFFWCAFVGMPLLFVGGVMCKFGYLGDIARYIASESAPVAKDTINYLGEETQPGVKSFTKAITEGVLEAKAERPEQHLGDE